MRKKYLLPLIALLASVEQIGAQMPAVLPPSAPFSLPQMAPATPEAASLIKSLQYPVNYAQGKVDITIPLYEITVGDVTIPLSISYNHKGVRTLEYTKYLGQGWILNAEPIITRKINGKPDRDGKYFRPEHYPDKSELTNLADPDNELDAFPDDYYYKISGQSGCFIFKDTTPPTCSSPTNRVITIPYEPIKVGYDHSPNPYSTSFLMIDYNGIKYEFDAVETTNIQNKEGSRLRN